jgi:hypothetical protein
VVTNQMLFNLGSSIRANILWLFSLSNACRKEIKGKKKFRIYYFMQTMIIVDSKILLLFHVESTISWKNLPWTSKLMEYEIVANHELSKLMIKKSSSRRLLWTCWNANFSHIFQQVDMTNY